jgi:hypothetical protein
MSGAQTADVDIADFNDRWLKAWSAKDLDGLCAFYADDCVYKDPQTVQGLTGRGPLRGYLEKLFGGTPGMTYTADEVWPIPGGFCGRWYCQIDDGRRMRGFDLVILKGDRIALNEVYLHPLPA